MISESPEIKHNDIQHNHKLWDVYLNMFSDLFSEMQQEQVTWINNAKTADTEVFPTGCTQVNIVWKPKITQVHNYNKNCVMKPWNSKQNHNPIPNEKTGSQEQAHAHPVVQSLAKTTHYRKM